MSASLTDSELQWAQVFTGLSLGAGPGSSGQTVTAIPAPGAPYKGTGRGANDPNPIDDEKERLERLDALLKKAKDGKPIDQSDIDSLDDDDKKKVLKAQKEAADKQIAFLQRKMAAGNTTLDFMQRLLVLQTDANEAEQAATDNAKKLVTEITEQARNADESTIDAVTAALPGVDNALKAAEEIRADRPRFEKQSRDAAARLTALSDTQLDRMSATDKAKALTDLVAAGQPKGDQFKALARLYKHTKLDPNFLKEDQKNERAIVASLKGNPDLKQAKKNWGGMDPDKKMAALQKIADAQCKVYGIPAPKIVREDSNAKNDVVTEGGFQMSDGQIHLNFGADSSIGDFKAALETTLHETAHAFQKSLADKFKSGQLKPTDPLFAQAALFAANEQVGANINDTDIDADPTHAAEILKAYEAQPNEKHSFKTSHAMSGPVLRSL